MLCRVEECGGDARYKKECLCQKHYFRLWRGGTVDLRRRARERYEDERGYQFIYAPTHPLVSRGQWYVSEQRAVLYSVIGAGPMDCAICKVGMTWKVCQADHIDEDPRNNAPENLRPLCRRCNVWRNMPPAHERIKRATALTFGGMTMTPHEWARDPRVNVTGNTIRRRKAEGMTDEQALFGEKKTHKS